MRGLIEGLWHSLRRGIWEVDVSGGAPLRGACIRGLRIICTLTRELASGELNVRAMSLVYTSLLAVVPLLAVSFAVLKALGVHNRLAQVMLNVLAPLGDKGNEITMRTLEFVDNSKVGLLGSVGVGLLLYTAVSMVQKVESAFNHTWHVAHPRRLAERVTDYLGVLLVGPVLAVSALGLTATITGVSLFRHLDELDPFGLATGLATRGVAFFLVVAVFMLAYRFIPNTKVNWSSAGVGGLVAGALWESTGWVFTSFAASTTQLTVIYSGFAIVMLLMIWVHLSWLILLIGGSVAFYHQHPEYLGLELHELRLSTRLQERLGLQVMFSIASHFYHRRPRWTAGQLAKRFDMPVEPVLGIIAAFERAGFVAETGDGAGSLLPARDLETITVKALLDVLRSLGEGPRTSFDRLRSDAVIDDLARRIDAAVDESLNGISIKQLVLSQPPPANDAGESSPTSRTSRIESPGDGMDG